MIRSIALFSLMFAVSLPLLRAKDDVPRGFQPIAEVAKAQASATADKRLLVVAVKGADDECPHCANAMENGQRAIGSGVVKVFARAEALNDLDPSTFPAALKERAAQKFTTGASVCFLVFSPDGTKLLAEAGRKELDDNPKATAAFKKLVADQKKNLK